MRSTGVINFSTFTDHRRRPATALQPRANKETLMARMNIMRRPSIFNPRVSRAARTVQPKAQVPLIQPTPPQAIKSSKGAVNTDSKTGKRKRNDDMPTQRVTRAKVGEAARSKQLATSTGTVGTATTEGQPAVNNPGKRTLVVVLQGPTQTQGHNTARETKPGKSAPRRPDGPSCKQCRQQHQRCDRGRPACGRCAKAGVGACEYSDTQNTATQQAIRSSVAQKKKSVPQQDRRPAKLHTKPGEPTKVKPTTKRSKLPNPVNAASNTKSNRTPNSRKGPKILTDATDLETFLKM